MTDREECIRARAHQIWEREGCPEGRGGEHWQQAVREIEAEEREAAKPAKKAPAPRPKKATSADSEDRRRQRALAAAEAAAKAHGLSLDEVLQKSVAAGKRRKAPKA